MNFIKFEGEISPEMKYININEDQQNIMELCVIVQELTEVNATLKANPGDENLENKRLEYLKILVSQNVNLLPDDLSINDSCKSKVIICTIEDPSTNEKFVGINSMRRHLKQCPRHVNKVDSYSACREHCLQSGHGEVMAVANYLFSNKMINPSNIATLFPKNSSTDFTEETLFGVVSHESLLEFIKQNQIKFPPHLNIYLYGHVICCDDCKRVLNAVGVNEIFIDPKTHEAQYERRKTIHGEM